MKTTKENKAPKTVQVKVLAPWMIIIIMVSILAGFISGWIMRSGQVAEIKAAVASVTTVKK